VDEPRPTVEDADKLVTAVMQRLAEGFANEPAGLEKHWDHGDNVSTEDLRVALQRYVPFLTDCGNYKNEHAFDSDAWHYATSKGPINTGSHKTKEGCEDGRPSI
jgi:hypothetical protein